MKARKLITSLSLLLALASLNSCSYHNFGSWITLQEVSDYQKGIYKRECVNCHEVEYRYENAHKFSWFNVRTNDASIALHGPIYDQIDRTDIDDVSVSDGLITDVVSAINRGVASEVETTYKTLKQYREDNYFLYEVNYIKFNDSASKEDKELAAKAANIVDNIDEKLYSAIYVAAVSSTNDIKEIIFGTSDATEIDEIINGKAEIEQYGISEINDILNTFSTQAQLELEEIRKDLTKAAKYIIDEAEGVTDIVNARKAASKIPNDLSPVDLINKYRFGRQYGPDDMTKVFNNIKTFLGGALFRLIPSSEYLDEFDRFNTYSLASVYKDETAFGEYLDNYVLYVDEVMNDHIMLNDYFNLWLEGEYFFSNSPASLGTAFVSPGILNHPFVYFSATNQDVFSVAHEFGHFFAEKTVNREGFIDESSSYDIFETHSQGNEMCFANFLKNKYPDDKMLNFAADYNLLYKLRLVEMAAYAAEVEYYVYDEVNKGNVITPDDVINYANSVYPEYFPNGIGSKDYWFVGSFSPLYYISYSTSAFASMQYYFMEIDDAIKGHQKLISSTEPLAEEERWKNAGLPSPFEYSGYITLNQKIKEIKNKYNL